MTEETTIPETVGQATENNAPVESASAPEGDSVKVGSRPQLDPTAVDAALQASGGKRNQAAVILGITTKRLDNIVYRNPVLKEKWGKSARPVITPADALSRGSVLPPSDSPPRLDAPNVIASFEAENSKMIAGLDNLQLGKDGVKLALAMQAFAGQHFRESIELVAGGMTRQSILIQLQMDRIIDRLNFVRSKIDSLDGIQPSGAPDEDGGLDEKRKWFDMVRAQWVEEEDRLSGRYAELVKHSSTIAMVGNEMRKTTIQAMLARNQGVRPRKAGLGQSIDVPSGPA